MKAVAAVLRKEARLELRTRESVPAMTLFALTVLVVFHFGLRRSSLDGELAAGVLWVTLLLAAILGLNRLFVAEREQGGFDGFLLAPVDRSALLVAKALALLTFLVAVEVVALPAFAVLLLGPSLLPPLPELLGIVLLADIGIAVVGTLAAALAIQTTARDLIAPLIALPLLVPVLIGATRATAPLLGAQPGAVALDWVAILGLYDVVFALLSYAVFDFLLEE